MNFEVIVSAAPFETQPLAERLFKAKGAKPEFLTVGIGALEAAKAARETAKRCRGRWPSSVTKSFCGSEATLLL